jgi:glutaredoxin
MSEVIVYSSDYCPYCSRAKYLLENKGVAFKEIKVDGKPQVRAEMAQKAGARPCRRSGSAASTSAVVMICMPWSAPASSTRCSRPERLHPRTAIPKRPKIDKDLR